MSGIYLACPTCPDPYPMPEVDGVPTLRPDLLTTVQTSAGPRFMGMCPQCADNLFGGKVEASPV